LRYFAASIFWCTLALAQAPDDSSSVEGTVVNAATGDPIRKVRVTLRPMGEGADPYGTTTDAKGHFLIDGVDAGRYRLSAFRNGYTEPRRSGAALTLEKGQNVKDVVLKLAPEGVISGRVLDGDGDPLANVSVVCMNVGYENGKRGLVIAGWANTNDLGEFRLPGLRAGKYVVRATFQQQSGNLQLRPVRTEEAYVTTYYPRTMNAKSASTIEVSPGAQITGINLMAMRAQTLHIKGRVGATIPVHAMPILLSLAPRDDLQSAMPELGAGVDAQGNFQLGGVVPGSYVLRASCMALDGKVYSGRMPVEVRDSNVEGIELELRPPRKFRGRVIIEDQGDLRGASLYVQIQGKAGVMLMGNAPAQVKGDLTFESNYIGVGPYEFSLHGYPESFYLKSIRVGDQDVTETGGDFDEDAAAGELTFILSPNAGVVEGSVQNAKEEAAPGAKVTLIPDSKHRSLKLRYEIVDADQKGHFVIKGVAPGEYKIYAWEDIEEGAYEDPDFMKPHESEGKTVSIKERGHETVELKAIPER
jgi:hypothetical protein